MDEDTKKLVNQILDWWKDARCLTTGDYGDYNVFDDEPEFVTKALELKTKLNQ